MRSFLLTTALVLSAGLLSACEDFVTDVDPPIDLVDNDSLNSERQVPFLVTGVQQRFATSHDQLSVAASGLSDEFVFDQRVRNATFPTYRDIDDGDITLDNNTVRNAYRALGQARFYADDLARRAQEDIEFEDFPEREATALYTGYLYGGIARYFYAVYIGLDAGDPASLPAERANGGIIGTIEDPGEPGPFIPAAQMYDLAVERFNLALENTTDAYQRRAVNSLIAQTLLYKATDPKGGSSLAAEAAAIRAAAENGLQAGDPAFASQHSVQSPNEYWSNAGIGRTQFSVPPEYTELPDAEVFGTDPEDGGEVADVRIPLGFAPPASSSDTTAYYRQVKYFEEGTPLPLVTWQETALILAEVALQVDGDEGTARDLINDVRASYGLDDVEGDVDLNVLLRERQAELFATGDRLLDQRRYPDQEASEWHLGAEAYRWLPIPDDERNINPNL